MPQLETAPAILQQQLRDLNDTNDELDVEIARLSAQQQAVQAQIRTHGALLAPIRRLPDELLSYIFLLIPRNGSRRYEFVRVCRRWCTVALHTAKLWTHIEISSYRLPTKNDLLRRLAMTAQAPLHIDFHDDDPEPDYARLLYLLYEQSARWETAQLRGAPQSVMAWDPSPLPMLRAVTIEGRNDSRELDDEEEEQALEKPDKHTVLSRYLHLFREAPNIESVSIQCLEKPAALSFPSSWTKIRQLSINCTDCECMGRTPLRTFLPALFSYRHTLRSCNLCANDLGLSPDAFSSGPLVFPRLEELVLCGAPIQLCVHIVAPRLRRIEIDLSLENAPARELAGLIVLLEKSSGCPDLRSATFRALNEEPADVIDCLSKLPSSVVMLDLFDGPHHEWLPPIPLVTLEVLEALTLRQGCDQLLPQLTSLHLWPTDDLVSDMYDDADGTRKVLEALRDSRAPSSATGGEEGMSAGLQTLVYDDNVELIREGEITGMMPKIYVW
ncbi:hypothetical protein K523DRAFT_418355 [Schizophyllum commune Tattone D]|nr:hypothetical protein K523DRAFT_418355 [Schizophyllum commune Tattone D]